MDGFGNGIFADLECGRSKIGRTERAAYIVGKAVHFLPFLLLSTKAPTAYFPEGRSGMRTVSRSLVASYTTPR
jgi:hypothetical protein